MVPYVFNMMDRGIKDARVSRMEGQGARWWGTFVSPNSLPRSGSGKSNSPSGEISKSIAGLSGCLMIGWNAIRALSIKKKREPRGAQYSSAKKKRTVAPGTIEFLELMSL